MAFQNFSFPRVIQDLGLTFTEADLFSQVSPTPVRPDLLAQVLEGASVASAINTEKARSEFAIAPVLWELRRLYPKRFGLFSGVELNADPSRGLNGVCDFVISRAPIQHFLTAPLLVIVEAKNDNVSNGLGQCIAALCAAQVFNQTASAPVSVLYGASTTGSAWKFLRLADTELVLDVIEYHVENLPKILGILKHILETTELPAASAGAAVPR